MSKSGEPDDERVIEIRSDIAEQIIEAQLKIGVSKNQLTPSRGGSLDSKHGATLGDAGCRDVHEVQFAFCGRSEVLREMWQHNVPTSSANGAFESAGSSGYSHLRALQTKLFRRHEVLRTLWNSDRKRVARLASAQAG